MILFIQLSVAIAADFTVADQKVVHQVLLNGLDVVWIDDNNPVVDLYTVYAVGAYMDSKPHLAHMTEHTMFCTKDGAYDDIIKQYADETNAYTRDEHTTYYTTNIPNEHFQTVLDYEL